MPDNNERSVRRVVTGHDASGKSVFASDELVASVTMTVMPGSPSSYQIWGADEPPHFPDSGTPPPRPTFYPPVGGYRFGMFTIPPEDGDAPPIDDVSAALAEVEAQLPGMLAYMEMDDPGMHTTDTADFEVILSGSCVLELDGGAEVELHPGDTVVQNGTRHRWKNRGTESCRVAVFVVGAHHERVPAK